MKAIAAVALASLSLASLTLGAGGAASHVGARAPRIARHVAPRTVWDSVYTEDQAKRGEKLFKDACARCHAETLKGIDDAPPLAGSAFLGGWNGKTLSSLFERINSSMPSDDPGTLSKPQIADLIAYILRYSAFPAGAAELPPDPAQLIEIRFTPAKP